MHQRIVKQGKGNVTIGPLPVKRRASQLDTLRYNSSKDFPKSGRHSSQMERLDDVSAMNVTGKTVEPACKTYKHYLEKNRQVGFPLGANQGKAND